MHLTLLITAIMTSTIALCLLYKKLRYVLHAFHGHEMCVIFVHMYYYYYYHKCKYYSDAIMRRLQGHFTIVRVSLNSRQCDDNDDRPQTSDGQVSFR